MSKTRLKWNYQTSNLCPLLNLLNSDLPEAKTDSQAAQHCLCPQLSADNPGFTGQSFAVSWRRRRHSIAIYTPCESWNALCFIKITSKHLEPHLGNTEAILTFILKVRTSASRVKVKCWAFKTKVFLVLKTRKWCSGSALFLRKGGSGEMVLHPQVTNLWGVNDPFMVSPKANGKCKYLHSDS